jgi:uncharacterized protein (TIGR02996 family)
MPDERAFLAAITAAPADDAVRLVFADWLDENGQSPRAEFIRAQVEAETLHPHAARRAELEARAERLLADHWIEWWSPVCESVGLPLPVPPRASRLGRFAQAVGVRKPTGDPFALARFTVYRPVYGSDIVEFRRGFPDTLLSVEPDSTWGPFLPRWTEYPLASLRLTGEDAHNWEDGPHLAGLSALELETWGQDTYTAFLRSRHLTSLEDLTLINSGWGRVGPSPVATLAGLPLAARLRRLSVSVYDDASAIALADANPNLTALDV